MTQSLGRYHRQILLPCFGEAAQRKLLGSTALILGCGALGTMNASMLARAGVGRLIIIDRDFIEMTNLQRQILFNEADVANAIPKAAAAKEKLSGINSDIEIISVVDDINHANLERYCGLTEGSEYPRVDIIVDGVDNFETRYLANDIAVKHGIPYIYGGAVGTFGAQYAILPHTPGSDSLWEKAGKATPCLRCIFEQMPPPGLTPTCDTAGVLGPVVSIIANLEVVETIKVLIGDFAAVRPTMLNIDVWENTYRQLKIAKAYDVGDCPCCKHRKFEFLDGHFGSSTTTLCGRNAVQLTHKQSHSGNGNGMNFDEIADRLRKHGKVTANKFMIRAELTDNGNAYELTLFTDGRAIVKGTKEANVARSIYAKYVGA